MYYFSGPQTRRCRIIEVDPSLYTTLLIYDIDNDKYLMVTVFPNWSGYVPKKGDYGYIEFEFVKGGLDTYYDKIENKNLVYCNTYLFFRKFIVSSESNNNIDQITI